MARPGRSRLADEIRFRSGRRRLMTQTSYSRVDKRKDNADDYQLSGRHDNRGEPRTDSHVRKSSTACGCCPSEIFAPKRPRNRGGRMTAVVLPEIASTERPRQPDPLSTPFLNVTPNDKTDAVRLSELTAAILTITDQGRREQTVQRLLQQHGNSATFVNARDSRGRTPLIHAVAASAIESITALITCPTVDLLTRDRYGNTALMYAVSSRNYAVVRLLLSALRERYDGEEKTLISYLHTKNYDGTTALVLALKTGNENCVFAIGERLRDANRREQNRKTSFAYRLGWRKKSPPTINTPNQPVSAQHPAVRRVAMSSPLVKQNSLPERQRWGRLPQLKIPPKRDNSI